MGDLDHEEFRRSSAPDCLDPKELETGLWESVAGRGTSAVLGWGLENERYGSESRRLLVMLEVSRRAASTPNG